LTRPPQHGRDVSSWVCRPRPPSRPSPATAAPKPPFSTTDAPTPPDAKPPPSSTSPTPQGT